MSFILKEAAKQRIWFLILRKKLAYFYTKNYWNKVSISEIVIECDDGDTFKLGDYYLANPD